MIKRKSVAGKLAQAIYDARMEEVDAQADSAPKFPKTSYGSVPSLWVTAALSALEHLEREWGFAPEADPQATARQIASTMMVDLAVKETQSPAPPGSTWLLGYDDHGMRRPSRDALVPLPDVPVRTVNPNTCAGISNGKPCPVIVSRPGRFCGAEHTGQADHAGRDRRPSFVAERLAERIVNNVYGRFMAGDIEPHISGRPWSNMVDQSRDFWREVAHGLLDDVAFRRLFLPEPAAKAWDVSSDGYGLFASTDTIHPGQPGTSPEIAPGRIAAWCDGCGFYREDLQELAHFVVTRAEAHHQNYPAHHVTITRNPETEWITP